MNLFRFAALLASFASLASGNTLFFSGNLRTDSTFVDCGPSCTLGPSDTDDAYAQFAAVVGTFTLGTQSTVSAVTYSYAGGVSLTGPVLAAGGFEPYLSLFDAAGNFLTSTFPPVCPPGANTVGGNCFDVLLSAGVLGPGVYQFALTAWQNLSRAENGSGSTLADGFTGLGSLAPGETLNYAFDVITQATSTAPEPGTDALLALGGALLCAVALCKKLKG